MDPEERQKRIFAGNLRGAFLRYLEREGRVRMSRRELGELVAKEIGGKREPFDHSSVKAWFEGTSIPGPLAGVALGRVLGTTYGALLGEEPQEPAVDAAGGSTDARRKRGGR